MNQFIQGSPDLLHAIYHMPLPGQTQKTNPWPLGKEIAFRALPVVGVDSQHREIFQIPFRILPPSTRVRVMTPYVRSRRFFRDLSDQGAAGSRSITSNANDPGRTDALPRPVAGGGPNFAVVTKIR